MDLGERLHDRNWYLNLCKEQHMPAQKKHVGAR
jgi:hypothetical protein